MFDKKLRRSGWLGWETAVVVAALLLGLFAVQAFAVDPPSSKKMMRQIGVMEGIIDQVLVDSPNFLVHGSKVTRGIYIGDFGVIFGFDASIVRSDWKKKLDWSWGKVQIEETEDGAVIIRRDRDAERGDRDDDEDDDEDWLDVDKIRSHEEMLYVRGKTELVDVLLDYGDTITTMPEGSHVAIVAFLRDSDYFMDNKISRLVLKAKVDDLRAYAAERISEEEMIKRIVEEEF